MLRARTRAALTLAAALLAPIGLPAGPAYAAGDVDLTVEQTAAYLHVGVAEPLTVVVTNGGPGSTGGGATTVTETLASTLELVGTPTGDGWDCSATAGRAVSCTSSADVASGATFAPITITVRATVDQDVYYRVRVAHPSDPNTTNNSDHGYHYVGNSFDLSISKFHAGTFTVGENEEFTIIVSNDSGSSTSGLTTTVTDVLPASMTFVSAGGTGWSCNNAAGTVTCTSTTTVAQTTSFPPITLFVTPTQAGEITNTASVSTGTAGGPCCEQDASDNTDSDTVTVNAGVATTTLTTTATPSATLGQAISDSATISGGNAPTGTITFTLYGPDDALCDDPSVFTSTVPVATGGPTGSGPFTPTAAGVYRWTASYSGDGNNSPSTSPCNAANETSTVSTAATQPHPDPEPTPSATPTPSPTTTPTATPTPTPTPTPTSTPSPTLTPSPGSTPPAVTSLVIALSHGEITAGNRPRLSGVARDSAGNPVPNVRITIAAKVLGVDWTPLPDPQPVTDTEGRFSVLVAPVVQTSYGATAHSTRSNVVNVRVHARINITVANDPPAPRVSVSGLTIPARAGQEIGLRELLADDATRFLAAVTVRPDGTFVIRSTVALPPGRHLLQLYLSATRTNLDAIRTFEVVVG